MVQVLEALERRAENRPSRPKLPPFLNNFPDREDFIVGVHGVEEKLLYGTPMKMPDGGLLSVESTDSIVVRGIYALEGARANGHVLTQEVFASVLDLPLEELGGVISRVRRRIPFEFQVVTSKGDLRPGGLVAVMGANLRNPGVANLYRTVREADPPLVPEVKPASVSTVEVLTPSADTLRNGRHAEENPQNGTRHNNGAVSEGDMVQREVSEARRGRVGRRSDEGENDTLGYLFESIKADKQGELSQDTKQRIVALTQRGLNLDWIANSGGQATLPQVRNQLRMGSIEDVNLLVSSCGVGTKQSRHAQVILLDDLVKMFVGEKLREDLPKGVTLAQVMEVVSQTIEQERYKSNGKKGKKR